MSRWGMVIDLDKCTGCQACSVACAAENNLRPGSVEESQRGRIIEWIHVLPIVEGEYPRLKTRYMPVPCQQCDNPPCTRVCPVRATYKNNEGIVAQIYPRCIGCRYCVNACPYTCKFFNWAQPEWPKGPSGDKSLGTAHNPDVSTRPVGVTEKCSFCSHRLQKAREQVKSEDRPLRSEGDYVPACVEVCPAEAMYFGDLDDLDSAVSKLAESHRSFRLQEELGTEPKVYYLTEG